MASQSEYNMLFKLSAQLGKEFGGTFSSAQKTLNETQKQIQALNKQQSDISAYQKQQQSVEATKRKLEDLQKQYQNIQKEIQETEGFSSSLENKLLEKQRAIEKTSASLENQTQKLDDMGEELRKNGVDTEHLTEESKKLSAQMDELADEQAKAAEAAEEYGDKGASAFEAVGSALIAAGVLKAMSDLIDLYKEACDESAKYADELITVSAQYNISAQDLQAYYYAAELVDVSVDTLTKSMSKNIKSMSDARDGSQKTAAAYESLGISVVNADGTLRDSEKVYWEVVDALGKVQNETERDALAQQLLGKSALELNTLIKAGSGVMNEYAKEAQKAGYILSDDVLATLGALDDAEQRQQNNIKALKNAVGSALAPEMTKLKKLENELLAGLTNFVSENPVLVKSVVALTTVAAGALAVYTSYVAVKKTMNTIRTISTALRAAETKATVAQTVATGTQTVATEGATAAQVGLNAAMSSNPIGLILTGIAALITGLIALSSAISDASKEYEELTEAERNFNEVLETSQKAYEKTSAEIIGAANLAETYVSRLRELEQQGLNTTEQQQEYALIVEKLNILFPDLNAEIDKNTGLLKGGVEAVRDYANAWKEAAIQEALATKYKDEIKAWAEAEAELFANKAKLDLAIENRSKLLEQQDALVQKSIQLADELDKAFSEGLDEEYGRIRSELNDIYVEIDSTAKKIRDNEKEQKNLNKAISAYGETVKKNEAALDEARRVMDLFNESVEEETSVSSKATSSDILLKKAVDAVKAGYMNADKAAKIYGVDSKKLQGIIDKEKSDSENLTEILQMIKDGYLDASEAAELYGYSLEQIETASYGKDLIDSLDDLVDKYNTTYEAAEKSIKGQYKLWDTAAVVIPTDIDAINAALETQLAYWEDYNTDLENLRSRAGNIEGLADIIAENADGSFDSVKTIAGMASASDDELRQMVEIWKSTKEAQEKPIGTIAEIATGYSSAILKIFEDFKKSIDELNLDEEAKAQAQEMIKAYAEAIRNGTWDPVTATEELAQFVANALAGGTTALENNLKYWETYEDAAAAGYANIRTKSEFYRSNNKDYQTYGTYDKYLQAMQKSYAPDTVPVSTTQKVTQTTGTTATGTAKTGTAETGTNKTEKKELRLNGRLVNSSGGGPKLAELYADGTSFAQPGVAIVGEKGPEMVMMHGGESVLNAQKTESLLGGSVVITISPSFTVNGGNEDIEERLRTFTEEIVEEVKDAIEQSGIDSKRSVYA